MALEHFRSDGKVTRFRIARAAVKPILAKGAGAIMHIDSTSGAVANVPATGHVDGDMTAGGIANPDRNRVWTGGAPMRRVARSGEMATRALFLCSPASSHLTGAVLAGDGGCTTI